MTDRWIYPLCPLDEAPVCDTSIDNIGGKAASLQTMARAGLPVPLTWVIPLRLCETYYATGRVLPAGFLDELQSTISGNDFRWAVRSGAAVSMPGTMESVLNCETPQDLERAIRRVLDSWTSPAALAYRQAKSLQHLTGTAVILQQMIETEIAGVLFTQDPLDSSSDTLIIEAVPGLGDQLVSGDMPGQRWRVSRESRQIVSHSPDEAVPSLLSLDQLQALTQYGVQLEQRFGSPVDVEWGRAGGDWVFFQARPIPIALPPIATTIPDQEFARLMERENARLAEFRQRGDTLWVRHNLCETLPFPTPLTWSILRSFMSGSGGYGNLYRQLGFSPGRRVRNEGLVELNGGQIYVSAQRMPDLYCDDFPFSFDEQELLRDPSAIDRAPSRLDLDRVGPWFLLRCPWIAVVMWRSHRRIQGLTQTALPAFQRLLPRYHDWVVKEREQPLSGRTLQELVVVLDRRIHRVLHEFAPQLLIPGVIGATLFEKLRQELTALSSPVAAQAFFLRLLQRLESPALQELNQAIASRASGALPESEFLNRFGHRCPEEMELAQPRWIEDPIRIPELNEAELSTSPSLTLDEAEADLREFLIKHQGSHGWDNCRSLLKNALTLLPLRETGKNELMRGYALLREACEALASVTGLGADLYFLTLDEVRSLGSDRPSVEISRRQLEWRTRQRFPHPAVIDERGLFFPQQNLLHGSVERQGTVISSGCATGFAWFPDQHPGERPPSGSILISSTLPPHFVSQFATAVGVVVDQSALLSHGAILARQFRIPVISQREATQLIREGDEVRVDAHAGSIHIARQVTDHPAPD